MRRPRTTHRRLLSVALLASMAACGSDATAPANTQNAFTVQEATTVAAAIFTEISRALSTSGFAFDVAPAAAVVPTTGTATVNSTCASGGTVTGTYTYTNNFGTDGTGTSTGTMSVATHSCKISTGTRVIAVDGQLTYTFSMTFAQNVALDTFNWRGTGSFTWSGGNCVIDYSMKYTGAATGKYTITGTICGVNVSSST